MLLHVSFFITLLTAREDSRPVAPNWRVSREEGRKAYSEGHYSIAEKYFQTALDAAERSGSDEARSVSLSDLARVFYTQGKYAQARQLAKSALEISERAFGPNSMQVSARLADLASILEAHGNYTEAILLCRRALAIAENSEDPLIVSVLNNLGSLENLLGHYPAAEKYYRNALELAEKRLGKKHSSTAMLLNNLGVVSRHQGHYKEAIAYYGQALAIRQNLQGVKHPDVASVMVNLSEVLCLQNQPAEAEVLARRALAIRTQSLGPAHPLVAASWNTLAAAEADLGNEFQAMQDFQSAITVWQNAGDLTHLPAALNNLGRLYLKQRRQSEAQSLFERAKALWSKTLGPDHPYIALVIENLGNLYMDQHKWDKAHRSFTEAAEINRKAFGAGSLNEARSMSDLAALLTNQHRYAEGEQLYQAVMAIEEKKPEAAFDLATTRAALAANYAKQGRDAEAAGLFRLALPDLERQNRADRVPLLNALDSYVTTLRKLKEYAEAERLEVKATGIRVKHALLADRN